MVSEKLSVVERARRRLAGWEAGNRLSLPVMPCHFVGDDLTAGERQARKLDHVRRWTHCDHPAKPLGEAVCGCAGCGPNCRGYAADGLEMKAAAAPPAYGPIPYPIPAPFPLPPYGWTPQYGSGGPPAPSTDLPRWRPVPPPSITPTRPRAVVTLVVGDDAEAMHAITGPGQKSYAERVGADHLVIRGATQDGRMSCAEKWRVKDYVPHFSDGTLYLDADVVVRPTAPDVFALVPPGHVGMRETTGRPKREWAETHLRAVCESQGVSPHPTALARYWNSGVWFGYPEHAGYWDPPAMPYPDEFTTEEHWCRQTMAVKGWPVFDFGEPFNWLWYTDPRCQRVAGKHFLHVSGYRHDPVGRLSLLRLLASMG